jgi:hypothetical protein
MKQPLVEEHGLVERPLSPSARQRQLVAEHRPTDAGREALRQPLQPQPGLLQGPGELDLLSGVEQAELTRFAQVERDGLCLTLSVLVQMSPRSGVGSDPTRHAGLTKLSRLRNGVALGNLVSVDLAANKEEF